MPDRDVGSIGEQVFKALVEDPLGPEGPVVALGFASVYAKWKFALHAYGWPISYGVCLERPKVAPSRPASSWRASRHRVQHATAHALRTVP